MWSTTISIIKHVCNLFLGVQKNRTTIPGAIQCAVPGTRYLVPLVVNTISVLTEDQQ